MGTLESLVGKVSSLPLRIVRTIFMGGTIASMLLMSGCLFSSARSKKEIADIYREQTAPYTEDGKAKYLIKAPFPYQTFSYFQIEGEADILISRPRLERSLQSLEEVEAGFENISDRFAALDTYFSSVEDDDTERMQHLRDLLDKDYQSLHSHVGDLHFILSTFPFPKKKGGKPEAEDTWEKLFKERMKKKTRKEEEAIYGNVVEYAYSIFDTMMQTKIPREKVEFEEHLGGLTGIVVLETGDIYIQEASYTQCLAVLMHEIVHTLSLSAELLIINEQEPNCDTDALEEMMSMAGVKAGLYFIKNPNVRRDVQDYFSVYHKDTVVAYLKGNDTMHAVAGAVLSMLLGEYQNPAEVFNRGQRFISQDIEPYIEKGKLLQSDYMDRRMLYADAIVRTIPLPGRFLDLVTRGEELYRQYHPAGMPSEFTKTSVGN